MAPTCTCTCDSECQCHKPAPIYFTTASMPVEHPTREELLAENRKLKLEVAAKNRELIALRARQHR